MVDPACNFTGLPRQIDIAAHLTLGALEPSAFSFSEWEFDKLCRQRDIPSSFLISFREECGLVQDPSTEQFSVFTPSVWDPKDGSARS